MFTTGLGIRADRVLLERIREINAVGGRYRDRGTYLETSQQGDGFYVERGGVWNDTKGRILNGCTGDDVRAVKSDLAKLGIKKTFDEIDALLSEALRIATRDERTDAEEFARKHREYLRARKKAQRESWRKQGRCTMCGSPEGKPRPAMFTDETGKRKRRATCAPCGERGNKRQKLKELAGMKERKQRRDEYLAGKRTNETKPNHYVADEWSEEAF